MAEGFELVRLRSGAWGIRSSAYGEVCHPGVGPREEALALYVEGLRLTDRIRSASGCFVVWDVGLGGGANALTVIEAAASVGGDLQVVSFDRSLEPLTFALRHAAHLDYLTSHEEVAGHLLANPVVRFRQREASVTWERCLGDFPELLSSAEPGRWPTPHAILWDPHSPAANPEMWTLPLFRDVARHLAPERPCALATYSRSTAVRVALLLAGFHVGTGARTATKEDSTVAANTPALIDHPLDQRWLERAHRSHAAEPWVTAPFRGTHLHPATSQALRRHPQFAPAAPGSDR